MEHFVTTISEQNKITKFIANQDKDKSLSILYAKGEDQISLTLVSEIRQAKCDVDFVEFDKLPDHDDVGKAFVIGKLIGKHGEISPFTDDPLILQLCGGKKSATARKPREKKEDEASVEDKHKKERKPRENKEENKVHQGENNAVYGELKEFLHSIATKEVNPATAARDIVNIFNNASRSGKSVEECVIDRFGENTGQKVISAIAPHKEKIAEILSRMG